MTDQILDIPVFNLEPNPDQPRTAFDETALQELAESIKEHGIIQPLIVYQIGEIYTLIAGERRWRAAQLAGLRTVPCVVRPVPADHQNQLELALIENIQREDLSVADEARAYQQLHDVHQLTDEQIAQRVGKARPTVTTTRNLAKLPEAVMTLIGEAEGQLPKRAARQLLPLAQAVAAPDLISIAQEIATLDPDDGREADDVIHDALEEHTNRLPRKGDGWDLAWPGKPIDLPSPIGEGAAIGVDAVPAVVRSIPACAGCPSLVQMKTGYTDAAYCTNAACFTAKTQLYAEKELARVSKKLGIPVAGADEQVYSIALDWHNREQVRQLIEQHAEHLRLQERSKAGDHFDAYQHKELLGSPALAIASTLKDALKGNSAAPIERAADGQPETEADSQKRIATEERAAKAKRAERGAIRRARADAGWLGLHVADLVAPQIQASGNALEFMAWFVNDRTNAGGNWTAVHNAVGETVDQLEHAKGKERERLLKRLIVLKALYEFVPSFDNDWESDWENVTACIVEVITGSPSYDDELNLGLKLPAGWDKPPIHKTPSNCWHCGKFAPNNFDELTQVDRADGWGTVSHGSGKNGVTLDDVYCPDCGKEIAAKLKAAKKPAPKAKR